MGEVANAISSFRELATQFQVRDEWASRVETCLSANLAGWGISVSDDNDVSFELNGHQVENVRIEQAYRGNFHFLAVIDGCEQKYVFRKGTEEHELINRIGISGLSKNELIEKIKQHLLTKIR